MRQYQVGHGLNTDETQRSRKTVPKCPSLFREGLGEGFERFSDVAPPLTPPHKVASRASAMANIIFGNIAGRGICQLKLAQIAKIFIVSNTDNYF